MSANTKPLTDVELENLVTEYERLTEKGYKLNNWMIRLINEVRQSRQQIRGMAEAMKDLGFAKYWTDDPDVDGKPLIPMRCNSCDGRGYVQGENTTCDGGCGGAGVLYVALDSVEDLENEIMTLKHEIDVLKGDFDAS